MTYLILDDSGYPVGGEFAVHELARTQARNWSEANGRTYRVVPYRQETSPNKWPPKYGPDDGERVEPSWRAG